MLKKFLHCVSKVLSYSGVLNIHRLRMQRWDRLLPSTSVLEYGIISAKCLKWTLFEELSFPAIAQERQERVHLFALQHISSDSECNQPDCNAA